MPPLGDLVLWTTDLSEISRCLHDLPIPTRRPQHQQLRFAEILKLLAHKIKRDLDRFEKGDPIAAVEATRTMVHGTTHAKIIAFKGIPRPLKPYTVLVPDLFPTSVSGYRDSQHPGYVCHDIAATHSNQEQRPPNPSRYAGAPIKPIQEPPVSDDKVVMQAVKKILNGRNREATKTLFGNGIAAPNEDTAAALREMFPHDIQELPPIPQNIKPTKISTATMQALVIKTMNTQSSLDMFGFTGQDLIPTREIPDHPFIDQYSRLLALYSSASLPPQAMFILNGTAVMAFNKVSLADQQVRIDEGKPPKLRPVNICSRVGATGIKAVLETQEGRDHNDSLQKHNVGAGTPAGVQTHVLSLRAAYEGKSGIATIDASNAFNTVSRVKMLQEYIKRCPGRSHLMRLMLDPSTALYSYKDREGREVREAIPVVMGVRQGCRTGADGYCTAIAGILEDLEDTFEKDGLVVKAATDDILCRHPSNNNAQQWHDFYERVKNINDQVKVSLEACGPRINEDKGHLLVPEDAPPPQSALFPPGYVVHGLVILGTPIGDKEYVLEHAMSMIQDYQDRADAITRVSVVNPLLAMNLLQHLNKKFIYYYSVTPPDFLGPFIEACDSIIQKAALAIRFCGDTPPVIDGDHLRMVHKIDTLPSRLGGKGLTPHTIQAPVSWLSTQSQVSGALSHEDQLTLMAHTKAAVDMIWRQHPPNLPIHGNFRRLLPDDDESLQDGTYFAKMQSTAKTRNLSGPIARGLLSAQRLDLRMCARSLDPHMAQLLLEATGRNQMGRLVTNPNISGNIVQKSPQAIAAYLRFTSGIGEGPKQCEEASCLASFREVDKFGMHAGCMRCPSTMGPKQSVHDNVNNVYNKYAEMARVSYEREVPVSKILGVDVAFAAARYPRHPNKAQREEAKQLGVLHDHAAALPPGPERDKLIEEAASLVKAAPRNSQQQRMDCVFKHTKPDGTQDERLVDGTLLHTLNKSHSKQSLKHQKDVIEGERALFFDNIPDPTARTVHPILSKAQTNKHVTYKPVINKANVSNSNFNTKTNLKMYGAAASYFGELSPDALLLTWWLTDCYRDSIIKNQTPTYGFPVAKLVSVFHNDLKSSLMATIAVGFGRMLLSAGLPFYKRQRAGMF